VILAAKIREAAPGCARLRAASSALLVCVAFTGPRQASPASGWIRLPVPTRPAGADRTARLWEADPGDFLRAVCGRVFRDLTDGERTQYGVLETAPPAPELPGGCQRFLIGDGEISKLLEPGGKPWTRFPAFGK
jgi:hypothetical protein